jgi:FO synthase
LTERLTIYPDYATDLDRWAHPDLHVRVLEMIDAEGFPRTDDWCPGDVEVTPPSEIMNAIVNSPKHISHDVQTILDKAKTGEALAESDIVRLFQSRGDDFTAVVQVRRCPAGTDQRQQRQLCRQPEHQLHQHLLLQMPVLRVFQGQAVGKSAWQTLRFIR